VSEGLLAGWANNEFFQGWSKGFFQGCNSEETLFYPLESKRIVFFAKKLTGKYQILLSRVIRPLHSPSDVHAQ